MEFCYVQRILNSVYHFTECIPFCDCYCINLHVNDCFFVLFCHVGDWSEQRTRVWLLFNADSVTLPPPYKKYRSVNAILGMFTFFLVCFLGIFWDILQNSFDEYSVTELGEFLATFTKGISLFLNTFKYWIKNLHP